METDNEPRKLIVYADGACRGNPGPMAIGASVQDLTGKELAAVSERLGDGTNNIAEYRAAIAGVQAAQELGADEVELRMDSQLIIQQVKGEWAVKNKALKPLRAQLLRLLRSFDKWSAVHVRREGNSRADALANAAY